MTDVIARLRAPLPRPDGPFRLLAPPEAAEAFEAARGANRALRARHDELSGFEIVEVHPALLGGDPTALDNKRAVDWGTYDELIAFWHREAPDRGELPPCEPAPDIAAFAEDDVHVVLGGVPTRTVLRPLRAASPVPGLALFGTDGAGTAYAWADGGAGPGVYELPAIPPDPRLARRLGRTVSDLLDRLESGEAGS